MNFVYNSSTIVNNGFSNMRHRQEKLCFVVILTVRFTQIEMFTSLTVVLKHIHLMNMKYYEDNI